VVLGQEAVDEKSNEMTAVPALLERLDVTGCVVTGCVVTGRVVITDALNTQKTLRCRLWLKRVIVFWLSKAIMACCMTMCASFLTG